MLIKPYIGAKTKGPIKRIKTRPLVFFHPNVDYKGILSLTKKPGIIPIEYPERLLR
jgi:hypothetical protein